MNNLYSDVFRIISTHLDITSIFNLSKMIKIAKKEFDQQLRTIDNIWQKDKLIKDFSYQNDIIPIKYLFYKKYDYFQLAMTNACRGNHADLIKYFINHKKYDFSIYIYLVKQLNT